MNETIGGIPRRFSKMSGAGNDFLVFEGTVPVGPREAETIRSICRRGTGVGADGVLFVRAEGTRVVLDYYNADGGPARFCANGTRCAARFAYLSGRSPAELTVITGWGAIPAHVRSDGHVTLTLPEPVAPGPAVETFDDGRHLEKDAVTVSVGVPHLVVFAVDGCEVETLDVSALGPPLRRHRSLPDGANVNFVSRRGPSRLSVRSYERGVEGETLSCGSGVVASAVVAALRGAGTPPISVATKSGSALVVDFSLDGPIARRVTLTGDARRVFEGTLTEESL